MICFDSFPNQDLRVPLRAWNAASYDIDKAYQVVRQLNANVYYPERSFSYFNNPGAANLQPWAYRLFKNFARPRELLERVVLRPDLNAEVDDFFAHFLVASHGDDLTNFSRAQKQMLQETMRFSRTTDLEMFSECVAVRVEAYGAKLVRAKIEQALILENGATQMFAPEVSQAIRMEVHCTGFAASKIAQAMSVEVGLTQKALPILTPQAWRNFGALRTEIAVFDRCGDAFVSLSKYCQTLKIAGLGMLAVTGLVVLMMSSNSFSPSLTV